jgi:hypothetical protein
MKSFLDSINNPTEAQKLGKTASADIEALADLVARGDHSAAVELWQVATAATLELTSFCQSKPEMFESLARRNFSWPVLHSLHHQFVEENKAMLKNLNLAADTDINISGRFSFKPPANKIAIELYFVARALCRAPMDDWEALDWIKLAWTSHLSKDDPNYLRPLERWGQKGPGRFLPPLSKDTADLWKKAVPALFRLLYGVKFDEHPQLQDLRKSVFRSAKDNYQKVGGAGVVRKRMLQAVVQAMGAIAVCTKQGAN